MRPTKSTYVLTFLAMIAFAGNSLLCRWALKTTVIDALSFTTIRMLSGALTLWTILRIRNSINYEYTSVTGNWPAAFSLFVYATAFSYAYVSLPTGTGALLLFAAVQVTMIGYGFWQGERLQIKQLIGLIIALAGISWLLVPNVSAPQLTDSLLMLSAGIAWAIYSLLGKKATDPVSVSAGNFMLASIFSLSLSLKLISSVKIGYLGILLGITSGAVTSGIGYVVWYSALQRLNITSAAVVQLSVPIIAAIFGAIFLNDTITLRLIEASIATLSGIGLVLLVTAKDVRK